MPAPRLQRAHAAACWCATCAACPRSVQALRISVGTPEQNERLLASLS